MNATVLCILRYIKQLFYWLYMLCRFDIVLREILQTKKKLKELPDRSGEVAVITGGAMGFGLEVVKILIQCNFRVIVGDISSGENALKEIQRAGLSTKDVEYLHLNLKSLKSVRQFAENVLQTTSRIDLLFNNAGIMFAPYERTIDGYESQFQVNYLSHFLLTNLLLPKMKETGRKKELCCRVVHTASKACCFTTLNLDELEDYQIYACNKAYCDSKLAQVLHAKYLDLKLQDEGARVRVYSVHPGMVPSNLWNNLWWIVKVPLALVPSYRTTQDGANGIVYAAVAPELESHGGLYLDNCEPNCPNPQMDDFSFLKCLWDKSLRLTDK